MSYDVRDYMQRRARGVYRKSPRPKADDHSAEDPIELAYPLEKTPSQEEMAPVLSAILAELEAKDPSLRNRIDQQRGRVNNKWRTVKENNESRNSKDTSRGK